MVYSPVFTNTTENTYFELIDYLNKNYGDRAVASYHARIYSYDTNDDSRIINPLEVSTSIDRPVYKYLLQYSSR